MDRRSASARLRALLVRGLRQAFQSVQYRLLPGLCVLCKAPSRRALDLCRPCERGLPWIATGCVICALPLTPSFAGSPAAAGALSTPRSATFLSPATCGQCLTAPPLFDSCRAAFAYQEPVSGMIRRFKHHQGFKEGWILGELLSRHLRLQLSSGNRPDLIVPVPAHWRRRWQRGYNQTELLARHLSRRLNIPVQHRLLRAHRHHPPQQGLGRTERRANLRGSYCVDERIALAGLHIALLDDVVTTGATADELAQLLKQRGAMEVEVWTLARTPQGQPG